MTSHSPKLIFLTVLILLTGCGEDPAAEDDGIDDALLATCDSVAESLSDTTGFTVTPPTSKYLMTYHVCVTGSLDCNNPQNHKVRLAQSADGAAWSDVAGWTEYQGSVPEIAKRDQTLYIVALGLTKVDLTSGTATQHKFVVLKADGTNAMARDVAFGPELSDGRLSVVYVPPMQEIVSGQPEPVYFAEEVLGSDGTCFQYKAQIASTEGQSFHITDPDLFFDGVNFILYTSSGPNTHAFASSSIDGSYSYVHQVATSSGGGVPSGVLDDSGQVMTYANNDSGGPIEIYRAVHARGAVPSSFTKVISSVAAGALSAESPSVIRNE